MKNNFKFIHEGSKYDLGSYFLNSNICCMQKIKVFQLLKTKNQDSMMAGAVLFIYLSNSKTLLLFLFDWFWICLYRLDLLMLVAVYFNPLSANPTKWSNTLKQFVGNLSINCLSVLDHFVGLALKGLMQLVDISRLTQLLLRF